MQPTLFNAKVYAPTNGSIYVEVMNPQPQKYSIKVADISGKQLSSYNYTSQQGKNLFKLDSLNLAKGMYLVNIHCGQVYQSHKVVVQ